MGPKQYLQQVAAAERELEVLRAKVAHFEDLGLSITSHMSSTPVQGQKGASRVEMAAIGIVDALEDINAKIGAYSAIVTHAEKLIAKIPQETYRTILTLRYICNWKLPKIGEKLKYADRSSIYRAHGWALVEFGKVMDDGKRKTAGETDHSDRS